MWRYDNENTQLNPPPKTKKWNARAFFVKPMLKAINRSQKPVFKYVDIHTTMWPPTIWQHCRRWQRHYGIGSNTAFGGYNVSSVISIYNIIKNQKCFPLFRDSDFWSSPQTIYANCFVLKQRGHPDVRSPSVHTGGDNLTSINIYIYIWNKNSLAISYSTE